MKNLLTEERLNSTMEKWKNGIYEFPDGTYENILAEEAGEPQGMTFKGNPVHFSKKDECWKFTAKPVKYAFS